MNKVDTNSYLNASGCFDEKGSMDLADWILNNQQVLCLLVSHQTGEVFKVDKNNIDFKLTVKGPGTLLMQLTNKWKNLDKELKDGLDTITEKPRHFDLYEFTVHCRSIELLRVIASKIGFNVLSEYNLEGVDEKIRGNGDYAYINLSR